MKIKKHFFRNKYVIERDTNKLDTTENRGTQRTDMRKTK